MALLLVCNFMYVCIPILQVFHVNMHQMKFLQTLSRTWNVYFITPELQFDTTVLKNYR
jgi:hypothetical protein